MCLKSKDCLCFFAGVYSWKLHRKAKNREIIVFVRLFSAIEWYGYSEILARAVLDEGNFRLFQRKGKLVNC